MAQVNNAHKLHATRNKSETPERLIARAFTYERGAYPGR